MVEHESRSTGGRARFANARVGSSLLALAGAALSITVAVKADSWREAPKESDEPGQAMRPVARTAFGMASTVDPESPFEGERPRRILALYDSTETYEERGEDGSVHQRSIDPEVAAAHRLAELPLNHLGFAVDYHDVASDSFPGPEAMKKYRGILTWFGDDRMRRPRTYLTWLGEQVTAGRRVVVMERLGAASDLLGEPVPRDLVDRAWRAIGGRDLGNWTNDPSRIRLGRIDRDVAGFERPMPARLQHYVQYRASDTVSVHVQLERTDISDGRSDVVWTGPAGGFVMATMAYREEPLGERFVRRWLIDPFGFFERALGVQGWPRFDFTTLNGQRIFYSHIDGDGLDTLTELDRKTRCGAVVRDEILRKYDLPFTASVVVGLVATPPLGRGSRRDIQVARSIFALDNVEIGSHGVAHPLNWRGGTKTSVPGLPNYPAPGDIAGRGEVEIAASVAYINRTLAPPHKKCAIMLWTGWCNPAEEQLATAYRLGLRNMNGGDPRMDDHFPSYAHLVSPVRQVGGQFQYSTSAANDYILTDEWKPPYYRFRNVIQTFERTGHPRRVLPINVYFHFYLAQKMSGLRGLREVLDWVAARPLAPVFASQYVDIVRDFHWARLARRTPDRWVLRKGRALRTLRFDDPEVLVDVARSRGVLGFLRVPELGATYVHLDDSTEVVVQLGKPSVDVPYLHRASHPVEGLSMKAGTIGFETHGPGARHFTFAGLPPGHRYRLVASRTDPSEATDVSDNLGDVVVDAEGRLEFAASGTVSERIRVDARRVDP